MTNSETEEKQIEVQNLLRESVEYVTQQWKVLGIFTLVAIVLNLLIGLLGGTESYDIGGL